MVAGIPDHSIEVFVVGASRTAHIDIEFCGAKLGGGDGEAAIFLVGNFARMICSRIYALVTKSGRWIAAIVSCKLPHERLDNDC